MTLRIGFFDTIGALNPNPYISAGVLKHLERQKKSNWSLVNLKQADAQIWSALDLVILLPSAYNNLFSRAVLEQVKSRSKTKLIFWSFEDPFEFDLNESFIDLLDVFLSNDEQASCCYATTTRVEYLPVGADHELWYRAPSEKFWCQKDKLLTFVGAGYPARLEVLREIARNMSLPELLHFRVVHPDGNCPPEWIMHGRISPKELGDLYSLSLGTLYMSRSVYFANCNNLQYFTPAPRFFESILAGSIPVVSENELSLLNYFNPGTEYISYRAPQDVEVGLNDLCRDQQRYLEMLKNIQGKVLEIFRLEQSVGRLVQIINELMG